MVDKESALDESSPASFAPADGSELVIGPDTPTVDVMSFWPEPGLVWSLCDIFFQRVNPLMKIIHKPTLEKYVPEASSGPFGLRSNMRALFFSIFVMAVVSLDADECMKRLGYDREQALRNFSQGARLTFLRMGFLSTNDLTTLQAFTLYLVCHPSSVVFGAPNADNHRHRSKADSILMSLGFCSALPYVWLENWVFTLMANG